MNTQLNEKEQELLVLEIVDACVKYIEKNGGDFGDVLFEQVFANEAQTEFSKMVCKTVESLHKKGYITGTVNLAYDHEYKIDDNGDIFDSDILDEIEFHETDFKNIAISSEGRLFMSGGSCQELSPNVLEKVKPIINCIASEAMKLAVKTAMFTMLQALGLPV